MRAPLLLLLASIASLTVACSGGERASDDDERASAQTIASGPCAIHFDATTTPIGQSGTGSRAVAADFDKDGKMDVAVFRSQSKALSMFLGKGDGTFTALPVMPIDVGADVSFIEEVWPAVLDVNGDGKKDIVVGLLNELKPSAGPIFDLKLGLFVGHGDGTFAFAYQPASFSPTYDQWAKTATGDFDGDGHEDVLVTTLTHGFVMYGDATGALVSPATNAFDLHGLYLTAKLDAFVRDFDGDGRADILATDPAATDGSAMMFTSAGRSFAWSKIKPAGTGAYFPHPYHGVVLADFEKTTPAPDLAFTEVYANVFTGSYAATTAVATDAGARDAGNAGDAGAITDAAPSTIGDAGAAHTTLAFSSGVTTKWDVSWLYGAADFDKDGALDLLGSNFKNEMTILCRPAASVDAGAPATRSFGPMNSVPVIADFDGDGRSDVLGFNGFYSENMIVQLARAGAVDEDDAGADAAADANAIAKDAGATTSDAGRTARDASTGDAAASAPSDDPSSDDPATSPDTSSGSSKTTVTTSGCSVVPGADASAFGPVALFGLVALARRRRRRRR